jgi:cytochrome P450
VAQDDPEHAMYRKAVQPIVSQESLQRFEQLIDQRITAVLDGLPQGEEFDWVVRVSTELAGLLLVTLFDVPLEDRLLLGHWAETILTFEGMKGFKGHAHRVATFNQCLLYFAHLREERAMLPPRFDVISMLAHHPNTRDLSPVDFTSQAIALIAAASDTTRSTLSASINAINQFPAEWEKVKARPSLIPNMVDEIIRWQTPVPHQRRTALQDIGIGGKTIHKGDKVAMWYFSGNRDEQLFADGNRIIADRSNAGRHLSFGYGIHRCMGMNLAKLQARKLWEKMIERFSFVEITSEIATIDSNLSRGYRGFTARLHFQ